MSAKENSGAVPFIKPEPQDHPLPLAHSNSWHAPTASGSSLKVKPEQTDDVPVKAAAAVKAEPVASTTALDVKPTEGALVDPRATSFTIFSSPDEIEYNPENALKEGVGMIKAIKNDVRRLELGSKLRKEVWLREIESLQNQGSPTTMIAVCGATGAGKSSILNAILDDNVVPTSGMRACTAVVTEIAYHKKATIDADVSFLSEKEWRDELKVLLDDLVDEEGNLKRTTNLNSDAGIAWSKVHAVYPSIGQEQLVKMSVDQILARDPRILKMLGTTKNVVSKDSKSFAKDIAEYIDSKDQKRDKKKEKEKAKDKGEKSLIDILKDRGKDKTKERSSEGPAFWPLIRQVNVRCNAGALSTGAILVDLPGVADANAARNSIAKDYMKKCNCIWILAPITRAVDDKTAKDLLGDAFKTQLMKISASKCDDISCSEVVGALNLFEDPELEEIEERIQEYAEATGEWKVKENSAKATAREIEEQLRGVRAIIKEQEAHIEALENDEPFEPVLTKKGGAKKTKSKKRKNVRGGGSSSKKRKSSSFSDDEDVDMGSDDDFINDDSDSDEEKEEEESGSDSDESSHSDSDEEEVEGEVEEVTIEALKAQIAEGKQAIKAGRERLNEVRKAKKEASDALATLKKKQLKAQRDKNGFCSLKRSEFSRDVLKEDFRSGLKELDDADAEQRNPDEFDPTVNVRDYAAIDLPVFTCSARDYVRLKGQVRGDGEPTCFSNVKDTGIPALQEWCHTLTISSRERAARNFHEHLKTFANSVKQYIEVARDVTEADRATLKGKWESGYIEDHDDEDDPMDDEDDDDDIPGYAYGKDIFNMDMLRGIINTGKGLYGMPPSRAPKVDAYGEPVGITPRLVKEFNGVVAKTVAGLKTEFKNGLQEKCEAGAALASGAAVDTSDGFAARMHWASYRATLRRHGTFREDLNVELISPMTKNIASSWSKVFEADLFGAFESAIMKAVNKLLQDVGETAASGLKDRVKNQGELCVEEAKVALKKIVEGVRESMNTEQKEVSRCVAPHVQQQLIDGYERAMEERGKGSVARQKLVFHDFIQDNKNDIFEGGADTIMERLSKAAEAVGTVLTGRLDQLAEKIEVSIAVLWEGVRDDPAQVRVRNEVVTTATDVVHQIAFWDAARDLRGQGDVKMIDAAA
ncbi:hypothetical protein FA95DRAFT_1556704 [Auriscalpium vulgare]|uniref:Uncharacterized protein n=1 Tax=Auriscalpium vulgare TaxID=40419 RepID=A0ACB8S0E7_9AGAM|nr:hypothetical protein FA95DRAFT_1556704 [Auriscalpium vulgare]